MLGRMERDRRVVLSCPAYASCVHMPMCCQLLMPEQVPSVPPGITPGVDGVKPGFDVAGVNLGIGIAGVRPGIGVAGVKPGLTPSTPGAMTGHSAPR